MKRDITQKIKEKSSDLFSELQDILENAGVENAKERLAELCELEYALTRIEDGSPQEEFYQLTK